MKGLYIRKQLAPDYAALYDASRKVRISPELRRLLRDAVQAARRNKVIERDDKLKAKLKQFGNDGRWAERKIEELSKLIFQGKKPDNSDLGQWASVEIECIFPYKQAQQSFISYVRSNGFTRFVTLKNDGSVNPTRNGCEECDDQDECDCETTAFGKEIIVSFKYGDWAMLQGICEKLQSLGCTVNKSCGLHVHFDCRGLSARQVTTLGKRVGLCVPALKQLLPKSRQNNSYCQYPINGHRRGSRYSFVNLQSFRKHSTLEIRGHSGTIDAVKIINWIKIIKLIMSQRNSKPISNVYGLLGKFEFETELADYITKRFQKFLPSIDLFGEPVATTGDDVTDDEAA